MTRLDLSSNNLEGKLPDSAAMLKSLSTLHLQNNRLTGRIDVLRDLPLKDLNVENNLFLGSIPEKMLSIPKFLRNGNNFTIPLTPGSSPTPATPSPSPAAHPHINVIPPVTPEDTANGVGPPRHGMKVSPAKAAGYSVLAAISLTIAVVVVVVVLSRRRQERSIHGGYLRGCVIKAPSWRRDATKLGAAISSDKERITVAEEIVGSPGDHPNASGSLVHPPLKNNRMPNIVSDNNVQGSSEEGQSQWFTFRFFTVASLQQCTNSFSDQNLMRETRFGKIYLAEHLESKFVVLHLCDTAAKMAAGEFLKKVQTMAGLQHPNIEELVGCCVEHGQRLLVYKHFSEHTLDDMIHGNDDDNPDNNFPWESRVAVALESAKALEYLHDQGGEGDQEGHAAVVHGHFRPEHVLVDVETMRVRVARCGLTPFVPTPAGSTSEDYWHDDDAPPEQAAATAGDVYSFGVVLLQLLTGRRPYDGAHPRGERLLVPWACARLHDLSALRRMADPRLWGATATVPVRSLSRFADVISRCLQREAEFRPAMAEVVQDLRRAMEEARTASDDDGYLAPARG
uniref:Uncharacterized protein n=3 Tax=Avena sativa TaxID=4498 RepID=A0ACD5TCE5_AVESA